MVGVFSMALDLQRIKRSHASLSLLAKHLAFVNSVQVSLFIRALIEFYAIPYTETLSYFQIAGIHGYPGDLAWDNSDPPKHDRKDDFGDHMIYCTHNLVTFPTWHRPYMLLFEQRLHELMGDIINGLTFSSDAEKQSWIDESNTWRLPYWDWASVSVCAPLKPDGSPSALLEVDNPLYRYQLVVDGNLTQMGDEKLGKYRVKDVEDPGDILLSRSQCSGTSRWGITGPSDEKIWSPGVNNFGKIEAAINGHEWYKPRDQPIQPEILLESLTPGSNWEKWLSLEYIHNNLHGFIGGNDYTSGVGHMQNVPSAAFDPVFYMHHANVDRLCAIWQTLNWSMWFTNTGTQPPSTSDLPPFHMFDGSQVRYFNSDDVRETRNSPAYLDRVREYVETTYPSTGRVLLHDEGKLFKEVRSNSYDDYIIDVLYDRYALNGSPYTLHFFLGPPPSSEAVTIAEVRSGGQRKYIGSVFNFSTPVRVTPSGDASCDNCKQQLDDGVLSTATVPLTVSLYQLAIDDAVTDINDIGTDALSGTVIPWEKMSKTKVFVLKGTSKHYVEDEKLSDYGEYQPMHVVTEEKPGGASEHEYAQN
ncbi:common central domain of tyrosinase-domain-containing protein [Schizothecium vesticola]|uniref:tyrosinase n=1 Tax=Schizothecium vesticola TaxID=314040 RepID=A0AA40F7U2_9PEZI|nr:common central domain of tyrosinase-domain-containing protein [Schizothecium vesticola]